MIPSLQHQYALAHCMLYGEPKPAIPENLLRYFGPRQFPGTTSIGYRQIHPEIFQDTLDTPLETFDVWLERAVMRTASAIAKAETGCQRRSPAKTTPLPQMVEQVAGILSFKTKGCRNFEMLRGRLPVPWYASFNCNRALSIRTVGVDGPPVFLRIPPGLNAYDGFTQPRMGPSPSYPNSGVRFARMTTTDLLADLTMHRNITFKRMTLDFYQSIRAQKVATRLLGAQFSRSHRFVHQWDRSARGQGAGKIA